MTRCSGLEEAGKGAVDERLGLPDSLFAYFQSLLSSASAHIVPFTVTPVRISMNIDEPRRRRDNEGKERRPKKPGELAESTTC